MSHDDRIYFLVVTWFCVVGALAGAVVVMTRWHQRPWRAGGLAQRALVAAVLLPAMAVWLTILHLN